MNEANFKTKNYAKVTGILFITATVAGLMSAIFLGSALEGQNYLEKVSSKGFDIYFVVIFELVMAIAVALIPISMYPVLKKYNYKLSVASVSFRVIEGAFFIVGALMLLLLFSISQDYSSLNSNDSIFFSPGEAIPWTIGDSPLITLGETYKSNLPWIIGGLFFTIGASLYYIVFYESRIIPRWLTVFGFLGVSLAFISYFLQLTNFNLGELETFLHFPIFIQEMVLAIWLIVKGYDTKESTKLISIERIKHNKSIHI